jgi:hypothetical protein
MAQVTHYLNEILEFFRVGFTHVNAMLGLLIALFATYQMGKWQQIWASSLGATVIHVIAMVLVPMIDHNAPFHLPPLLDLGFWRDTAALFVGYVVAIAALFFVKSTVLARSAPAAAHH